MKCIKGRKPARLKGQLEAVDGVAHGVHLVEQNDRLRRSGTRNQSAATMGLCGRGSGQGTRTLNFA